MTHRPVRRLTALEQDAQQLAIPTPPPRKPAMTEATLLTAVRKIARLTGWLTYHTHDSRRSEPGFPDLVLLHTRRHRLIFAELKTDTGRLTPDQENWLAALAETGHEIALWRPTDLDDEIRAVLTGLRATTKLTDDYRTTRGLT